jgi:hypothetical protein
VRGLVRVTPPLWTLDFDPDATDEEACRWWPVRDQIAEFTRSRLVNWATAGQVYVRSPTSCACAHSGPWS